MYRHTANQMTKIQDTATNDSEVTGLVSGSGDSDVPAWGGDDSDVPALLSGSESDADADDVEPGIHQPHTLSREISLRGTFDICHQCAANFRRRGQVSLWRMLGFGHTNDSADLFFQIYDFFTRYFGTSDEDNLINQLQLYFPLPGHSHNVADNAICMIRR